MSMNSDSKSKRSLKSDSPIPSSCCINSGDGKSSNNKKNTAQKTMGVALALRLSMLSVEIVLL
ncbi:hypothetical protein OROGR_030756 [Orobanche gracilis]